MRVFTKEELRTYDRSNGIAYVACYGKVYDVSSKVLDKDVVISTQDLLKVTKTKVTLNISVDELS